MVEKTHRISLKNIRIYAYHGCLPQEAIVGSHYSVDLEIDTDFSQSVLSDDLSDTLDYVTLNEIVKQEMKVRSDLIEHVAQRIINKIRCVSDKIKRISVEVSKLNPPINGDVQAVSVKIIE